MVALPDVTVVAIDCVAHELTWLAIEDTLREIEPADVIVFSDSAVKFNRSHVPDRDALFRYCDCRSLDDVARVLWYEVPACVRTSHFLVVQWDGWVLDGARWDPAWLDVDYLGAPWPWHGDGLVVGNGGFSLRSADMTRWVAANPWGYPALAGENEDVTLCRRYRSELQRDGFVWGSRAQAEAFSFEREPPRPTFGFHGAWNWPRVLSPKRLEERLNLANDYVRGKSEWAELMAAV
jgi:hypothetical protein